MLSVIPHRPSKEVKGNKLHDFFINGEFVNEQNFADIRECVAKESKRVYGG